MIYEKDLEKLIIRERLRAIYKGHPPFFSSLHEGFCVMKEEQEEFEEESKKAGQNVLDLWNLIKKDKSKAELFQCIQSLKENLINTFDELVMFATMVNKLEARIKQKEK